MDPFKIIERLARPWNAQRKGRPTALLPVHAAAACCTTQLLIMHAQPLPSIPRRPSYVQHTVTHGTQQNMGTDEHPFCWVPAASPAPLRSGTGGVGLPCSVAPISYHTNLPHVYAVVGSSQVAVPCGQCKSRARSLQLSITSQPSAPLFRTSPAAPCHDSHWAPILQGVLPTTHRVDSIYRSKTE